MQQPSPTDSNSRHILFGVPVNGSSDAFSGQYLRLEEYAGTGEDAHLPASLSNAGLKGIAISSTGYFLVNSKVGVIETFGKALTEAISGADHTITIEKGDWTLIAEEGEISIEATNKSTPSTMSLVSTDSDIVFEALNGKASTSDKYDIKKSTTNSVTFVAGFEYSGVNGTLIKENVGFSMTINVIGDLSMKILDVKVDAFPFKYTATAFGFLISSLKYQLISFKFGVVDSKMMFVYNKVTTWQIYNQLAGTQVSAVKGKVNGLAMEKQIAEAESYAANVSMWQLLKM